MSVEPIRVTLTVQDANPVPLVLTPNILPKIIEGISPEVTLEETEDGVLMTVTDKSGTDTKLIPKGPQGDDYVLTEEDKTEIATEAAGMVDTSGKADKVTGATNGNFAVLDANGNLIDSGSKASDFLTQHQDISGKQNKITASGLLKGDGNGGVTAATAGTDYGTYSKPSSGIPATDLAAGVIPDPTSIIDDTAGASDTNKVWSADKSSQLLTAINAFEPPAYDATSTYSVGDIVWYSNKMYRCNTAISTAEEWTAAHWTEIVIPKDVRVNGASIVGADGVANVPVANGTTPGVIIVRAYNDGLLINNNGQLTIVWPTAPQIKGGTQSNRAINPQMQHESAFYGLAKVAGSDEKNSTLPVGQYTESAKSAISEMLSGSVSVSGTTPSITALPGVRYVCGEVSTLDITVPASGDVEVIFESGSTATVLTVTPPTGVTAVQWANGFDPTSLDANTRYDLIITDGEWGIAASWA